MAEHQLKLKPQSAWPAPRKEIPPRPYEPLYVWIICPECEIRIHVSPREAILLGVSAGLMRGKVENWGEVEVKLKCGCTLAYAQFMLCWDDREEQF